MRVSLFTATGNRGSLVRPHEAMDHEDYTTLVANDATTTGLVPKIRGLFSTNHPPMKVTQRFRESGEPRPPVHCRRLLAVRETSPGRSITMTDIVTEPPRAHARIVYLGSVSPHWEIYFDHGDRTVIEEFRARALARLVLLPRDDPQFRRNRERIVRDAERERISLEWDLGLGDSQG